mmetsp:Transcript_11082/g.24704  ORF Transcript_11082/g.24704 Transcript_11082/m.24704 type:complete len:236 (+) Transcript_11082:462-1169(+)
MCAVILLRRTAATLTTTTPITATIHSEEFTIFCVKRCDGPVRTMSLATRIRIPMIMTTTTTPNHTNDNHNDGMYPITAVRSPLPRGLVTIPNAACVPPFPTIKSCCPDPNCKNKWPWPCRMDCCCNNNNKTIQMDNTSRMMMSITMTRNHPPLLWTMSILLVQRRRRRYFTTTTTTPITFKSKKKKKNASFAWKGLTRPIHACPRSAVAAKIKPSFTCPVCTNGWKDSSKAVVLR